MIPTLIAVLLKLRGARDRRQRMKKIFWVDRGGSVNAPSQKSRPRITPNNVTKWAKECLQCQRSKIQTHVKAPLKTFFAPARRRFGHVHIDLVGPLPESQGYKYLVTVINLFTRWPEAVPIQDVKTKNPNTYYVWIWWVFEEVSFEFVFCIQSGDIHLYMSTLLLHSVDTIITKLKVSVLLLYSDCRHYYYIVSMLL